MRLNKFLAHSGVASRRKCDELIFAGKVKINGETVKIPGVDIDPSIDKVEINGKLLKPEKKIYIVLNKPANVLSTLKDDFNRKIITDLIKDVQERVYPVGRLDYDVEGIILLTNDGDLSNRLIHPRFKVEKTYLATVKDKIKNKEIKKLEKGVFLPDDKIKTLPAKCKIIKTTENLSVVELTIREGRKRQVKNMFKAVNHPVIKLERIKFGPIGINGLKKGEWRYLSEKEIDKLYEITKLKNVKFD